MKIIPTKVHGILDYSTAILLLTFPLFFDYSFTGPEAWVPRLLGLATIIYSLLTDYEYGANPRLSMRTHLAIDFGSGLFLAASPWIFDFAGYIWQPHVIIGVMELVVVLLSRQQPSRERRSRQVSSPEQQKL